MNPPTKTSKTTNPPKMRSFINRIIILTWILNIINIIEMNKKYKILHKLQVESVHKYGTKIHYCPKMEELVNSMKITLKSRKDQFSRERMVPTAEIKFPGIKLPKSIPDYDQSSKFDPEIRNQEYSNRLTRLNQLCKTGTYQDKPSLLDAYRHNQVRYQSEPEFFMTNTNQDDPKKYPNLMYCALTKCSSSNWRFTMREIYSLNNKLSNESILMDESFGYTSRKDSFERIRRRRSSKRRRERREAHIEEKSRWTDIYLGVRKNAFDDPINPSQNSWTYKNENQITDQSWVANILDSQSNSFKFTFVRHPLERLLSAYRDKVQPGLFELHRINTGFGGLKKSKESKEF